MGTLSLNMRREDTEVFAGASAFSNSWILIRHTNQKSLKYVGHPECIPKPINCKFKTADRNSNGRRTAGLVVSGQLHPDAFSDKSKLKEWDNYAGEYGLILTEKEILETSPKHKKIFRDKGFGINVDKESEHYGCVTLNGKYLYGDYDLFDIVRVGDERRNMGLVGKLAGKNHASGVNFEKVKGYVNQQIGSEMIQHGGTALFSTKFEDVYVFTPTGGFESWSAATTENQYKKWNRQLINAFRP